MSEKNNILPTLRFPEFVNDGEWNEHKLKEFGDFFRGLTYNSKDTRKKGLLVLRSGNIQNDNLILDNDLVYVDKDCPKDLILRDGDVVICMSNGSKPLVGKNAEYQGNYDGKITVGAFCSIMRPINKFSKYFLQSDAYNNFIALSIGGGNINNLKNSDLEEFKCSAPKSSQEQQKIADTLSTLDEVITAHTERLEALQKHKKGLLQNLFPQEGEKVPNYRFPEFKKDGEWVEKTIEQIAKVTTGNRDTQNKEDNGLYPFFVRSQNVERINSYSFDGEAILTSGDGVGVGKNFHYIVGKFDFHQRVYCIYDFSEQTNGKYLFMFFSHYFYERVMRMSAKNSVDSVRMSMITEMPIFVPSKKEQQKIADTLSEIDTLITAQTEKIKQLQQHKKGLLQGLFPKVNS